MNVWLFTMSQRIDDAENTRTFLLARHLLNKGCSVTLFTSAFDHILKQFRKEHAFDELLPNGLKVVYISGCGYKKNVSIKRYFDHWLIAKRFKKVAMNYTLPNVAVISLPDHLLASAAANFLLSKGIPYIVDIRDQWPDVFLDLIKSKFSKFLAYHLFARDRMIVAQTIKSADSVVSMMNALLLWGQKLSNRSPSEGDRVFYLATTAKIESDLPLSGASEYVRNVLNALNARPFHLFVGTFGLYYNPILVVDALRILKNRGFKRSFAVVIGGSGTNYEQIKQSIIGLEDVYLTGWLSRNDIEILVSRASTGLIPSNLKVDAFPNKSFTYLGGGLPVISSVGGDLSDAINLYGLGLSFAPGNAEELASKLEFIESNIELLEKMRINVRKFFKNNLDSERTYNEYSDFVISHSKTLG